MTRCYSALPAKLTAGLDFQAAVMLHAYPAPDWQLVAYLRGPQAINLTATADGASHVFTADAATTAAWLPGVYWFALRATMGSATMEAGNGQLEVMPDLARVTGAYDGRSQFEIGLAAIDAVLGKRATQDQQRYIIDKRELWRMTIADLLKLRSYYAMKVRGERGGHRFGRQIPVRFSNK